MLNRENLGIKERLLNDLSDNEWTPELMAVAIAAKQTRRAQKPLAPINAFILDRQIPSYDEFITFYKDLLANMQNMPNGARFHLAVKVGDHWTFYDNAIIDGKLHIFNLDAAGVERIDNLNKRIQSLLPAGSIIYTYKSDLLYDENRNVVLNSEGEERRRDIQMDTTRCPIYVLDYVSSLSRIDVFSFLKNALKNIEQDPSKNVAVYYLTPDQIPIEMAVIFRTAQSEKVINSLPDTIKNAPVSKKDESLITYNQPKSIDRKEQQFKSKIEEFINASSEEELEKIIMDRGGVFISSNKDADELYHKMKSIFQPYVDKYKNTSFLNQDYITNTDYYHIQQKFCDTFIKSFLKFVEEKRYLDAAREIRKLNYLQLNLEAKKSDKDFIKEFKDICMETNNNSDELFKNLSAKLTFMNYGGIPGMDKSKADLGICLQEVHNYLGKSEKYEYSLRLK